MKILSRQEGFTIFEIIVSIALFLGSILIVSSIYTFTQRSYNQGANESELLQNARVSLDRMSRELRQAMEVVTTLPADKLAAASQIMFQDGHDLSRITCIKYYLDQNNLMRSKIAYYFSYDPATYVSHDSIGIGGITPTEIILDDNIIGEYFTDLKFWGTGNRINMNIELTKNNKVFDMDSSVQRRN